TSDLALIQELFVRPGESAIYISWQIEGNTEAKLEVRPFFSGRDFHSLQSENDAFRFDAETNGEQVMWRPRPDFPAVMARSNGRYTHQPNWYRNFFYTEEAARGLEAREDLAVPGI